MNTIINCLIIDDEPLARELIGTFLESETDFYIVGKCFNPVDAYSLLLNDTIDVIFLDIQMPVLTGIDFLRSLKHPPKIVFTTAHASYAADAFNLNVVDYLVKPISEERFGQAIQKLRTALHRNEHVIEQPLPAPDYVFFKIDGKLIKVHFSDIYYLEALKDFTTIHLENGKKLLVSDHLGAVQRMLPAKGFIRIHRSFIVAEKSISAINGNMVEIGEIRLPVGSSYKEQLLKALNLKRS